MVYRIVFDMVTPVITTAPIHLDGLLSAVHPAMHNLDISPNRFSKTDCLRVAPLEIDSVKIGPCWVWCCSAGEYDDNAVPFHDKFNKRKDCNDYTYLSGRITPRTGPGKDCMETAYGIACQSISFLFSAPKSKEVERVAKRIHNIGSLRKMGYGQVKGFRIEETGLGWKDVILQDGVAVRNLPGTMVDTDELISVHVRHPYWMPANMEDGVMAGMPCRLKEGVYLNEV